MTVSIRDVVESFEYLFDSFHDKEFMKTRSVTGMNEKELLLPVRLYLLGCFGEDVHPEYETELPGHGATGWGRIDFKIGDVAVEFAVRSETATKGSISPSIQTTEMKKLMKYDGKALLVLFDFSDSPYSEEELNDFRDIPSLGRGNYKYSAFNLAYFCVASRGPAKTKLISKNIRIN